jgi:hypothetical protein
MIFASGRRGDTQASVLRSSNTYPGPARLAMSIAELSGPWKLARCVTPLVSGSLWVAYSASSGWKSACWKRIAEPAASVSLISIGGFSA